MAALPLRIPPALQRGPTAPDCAARAYLIKELLFWGALGRIDCQDLLELIEYEQRGVITRGDLVEIVLQVHSKEFVEPQTAAARRLRFFERQHETEEETVRGGGYGNVLLQH